MKIIAILLTALLINGCARTITSYENQEITAPQIKKLASDGAVIMANHYPAGKTSLNINKTGDFGELLTKNLQQKGFGIDENGIPVNYVIDFLDEQYIHLGLITNDWRSDSLYLRQKNQLKRQTISQEVK